MLIMLLYNKRITGHKMKAQITKIKNKNVTIKIGKEEYIVIPRKKIKFRCHIGQNVVIKKINNQIEIIPDSKFLDETKYEKKEFKKIIISHKKPNKLKIFLIFVLVVGIITAIPLSIIAVTKIQNRIREEERVNNFNTCVKNAKKINDSEKYITEMINCYKSYGGDNADSRIVEYQEKLDKTRSIDCALRAAKDYEVSDEEWERSNTDINFRIMLLKRVKNGHEASKACYEKINDRETISSIEANIKDVQSRIEYLEGIRDSQSNYYGNTSLYCTTNTIGNYTYTNCY